jgi:signal transduction histidine kinase
VAKYANATRAVIRLRDGGRGLEVEITDDGRGFDPDAARDGTGIRGMSDRLDAIGGSLEVRSRVGSGTVVTARLDVVAAP